MATKYVSNLASNGYGLGDDTNGTGTQAAPYLTIQKALTVCANGDTINVNPSGTIYSETNGSGWLNFAHSATVQTDPTLVGAQGKITIQSTGTSYVAFTVLSNTGFIDVQLDCQSVLNKAAFETNAGSQQTGIFMTRVDILNNNGWYGFYILGTNPGSVAVLDKCTMTAANGNNTSSTFATARGSTGGAATSLTLTGCTATGISRAFVASDTNPISLSFGASGDGTRSTYSNFVNPFYGSPNGYGTLTVDRCDFTQTTNTNVFNFNQTATSALAVTITNCTFSGAATSAIYTDAGKAAMTLTVNNNTITSSLASNSAFISISQQVGGTTTGSVSSNTLSGSNGTLVTVSSKGVSGFSVYGNTVTHLSDNTNNGVIALNAGSSGLQAYNNTLTCNTNGHVIYIGQDGLTTRVTNSSATTLQNLGDVANNTYFAQPFTFPTTTTDVSTALGSLYLKAKKVGSPTGTVTLKLYSDTAGSPGSLLETSEYAIAGANLTGTATYFEFWFPSHTNTAQNTQYWMVAQYTGSVDGANYVQLSANTTGTVGKTAPDGSTWSVSANSTVFLANYGAFEITNPSAYNNKITNASTVNFPHGLLIGCCLGGLAYQNQVYNCGIGLIFKMVDGSANAARLYDNLVSQRLGTSNNTYFDKGSKFVKFYHNTLLMTTTGSAILLSSNSDSVNNPFNMQASQNADVKNNILYTTTTVTSAYQFGVTTYQEPTMSNATIDYNCVLVSGTTNYAANNNSGAQVIYSTLATLQGNNFDLHAVYADPKLAANTPAFPIDFIPLGTSPAIGIGTYLGGIVPTDYAGTSFKLAPTVGAYQVSRHAVTTARTVTTSRSLNTSRAITTSRTVGS